MCVSGVSQHHTVYVAAVAVAGGVCWGAGFQLFAAVSVQKGEGLGNHARGFRSQGSD